MEKTKEQSLIFNIIAVICIIFFCSMKKKYDIVYYCGIDDFLREYKAAVEARVNLE